MSYSTVPGEYFFLQMNEKANLLGIEPSLDTVEKPKYLLGF